MDERKKILLALQSVSELSNKKRTALLDEFEDATELASESGRRAVFKTLGDEHATEFFKLLDRADELAAELEKRDLKFITRYDDEYPEKLLDIYDAPTGLFAKGNLDALRAKSIAVVGTRRPTRYGAKVADEFSREFAKAGLTVHIGICKGCRQHSAPCLRKPVEADCCGVCFGA